MRAVQRELRSLERCCTSHLHYTSLAPLVRRGVLRVVSKPPRREYDESQRVRKFWKEESEPREPNTILLIGTCHVSKESAEEVKSVIEAIKPQAVVVELCKKRSGALVLTSEKKTKPAGNGEAAGKERERGGMLASSSSSSPSSSSSSYLSFETSWLEKAARMVLSMQAERIGKELNVVPGIEFRQAWASAKAIGAQVVLGDRPIDITLKRCWLNMTVKERLLLVLLLLQSLVLPSNVAREVVKQIDAINNRESDSDGSEDGSYEEQRSKLSQVSEQVASMFPGLEGPLFQERDQYMAWTLKRSKAVTNCDVVVGVLGAGHMEGVLREIEQDYQAQHLSFKKVALLQ